MAVQGCAVPVTAGRSCVRRVIMMGGSEVIVTVNTRSDP